MIKLATECPSSNIEKLITCQRSSGNEITFLTDVARDSQAKTMFVLEDYSFESFFLTWWWLSLYGDDDCDDDADDFHFEKVNDEDAALLLRAVDRLGL